jgi:PAS domain S-box-containing protein
MGIYLYQLEAEDRLMFVGANPAADRLVGVDNSQFIGQTIEDAFPPLAETEIPDCYRRAARDGVSWYTEQVDYEYGSIAGAFEVHAFQMSPGKTAVLFNNITERKRAEDELRRLRNYLSNIIDSMPSVLVGVDVDGKVTQWNSEAQRATGVPALDAVGQPLARTFPQLAAEMERVREAMQTRDVITDPKRTRREDDKTIYEDVTIYPLIVNGVEGAVIRVDDVTDQVHLEEMMIQSEKMLSVGGLAAGMAHEINNPLAGMMQTANVMANRLSEDLPANLKAAEQAGTSMDAIRAFMESRGIPRMLAAINESGRRVAEIVYNMLSFARRSDAQTSSHDVAELLDKTVELASTDYDLKKQYDFKTIEIVREYQDHLPYVPCEGAKIQQVFLNLLRNGAQAMQDAGLQNPSFVLRTRYEEAQGMVYVEIEDNGPGMDEDTRRRAFEPFFTTKPVGVGTGLGLSVSYFIVTKNHAGEMDVVSEPGRGTTFIVGLPVERSAA